MFRLMLGDCIEQMATLPDQSVHTCVTSPPYFGLRDYGHDGQIGLEATPDAFVARLVEVFREVRRLLRDDGTLWLNLGDSYASTGGHTSQGVGSQRAGRSNVTVQNDRKGYAGGDGIKVKDLIGIPWRVAFALQADGWYLRQDIIWHKPNPMPESVTDRCTKAHEYIFLLTKGPRYHYDAGAIKELSAQGSDKWGKGGARKTRGLQGYTNASGAQRDNSGDYGTTGTRNRRSVWTVTPKPFNGAHFATFPPDLIEPCILAGSLSGGTVLDPFGGSGTTAGVALKHGRRAVLCELNPDYEKLMSDRIESISGLSSDAWGLI